jgi:CheY-like chemotaxis protein
MGKAGQTPLNGARIMIVEDEPLIALDLAQLVMDAGGVVTGTARLKKEAASLIKSAGFDVALLDVRLPDGDSFSVARKLAEKGIPFVFCTGDNVEAAQFSQWPDAPVVAKPHDGAAIISSIARVLGILQ